MMMEKERSRFERDDFYDIFVTEQILEVLKSKEIDPIDAEKKLIEIVVNDDRDKLVRDSKSLFKAVSTQENLTEKEKKLDFGNGDQFISRRLALRFLHLACSVDSVKCAKALIDGEIGVGLRVNEIGELGRTALHCAAERHSKRCIELLLQKEARTDLRSRDDSKQLPIEMALSSQRMIQWDADQRIEDLLLNLTEMDLSVITMLAENTRGLAEIAYACALEGGVVPLAALLMVAPDKLRESFTVLRPDGSLASQETTTIYDCLVKEALSLGQNEGSSKRWERIGLLTGSQQRKLLLLEIELLQLFGAAVLQGSPTMDRHPLSPLIHASQAGDEEVVKLLLKTNIDINEVDGEGNSALHWHVKKSSNVKKLGILVLLIKNGANVKLKNTLGLTPLHVAAATGYFQALQVLLLKEPESVNMVSEMKETALFFAVKHDFINCAELLLRSGSNVQTHNLRKQRPMDLADSKDMRFLLNQKFSPKSGPVQSKESISWLNDYQSDSDGEMWEQLFYSKKETLPPKKVSRSAKTDICMYFGSPRGCMGGSDCSQHHEQKQGIKISGAPSTLRPKHRIFVGGLPQNIDSETLREVFQDQFGPVEDAKVITDYTGDQLFSRGFGFITFRNKESVAAAVELHYVNLWGKKVEIKGIVPKADSPATTPKAKRQCQGVVVSNADKTRNESMSWVGSLPCGQPRTQTLKKIDLTPEDPNQPLWLTTFKKWLPGFLKYVSKHLREGEWYALSSVKIDFKTRCGYHLDHASLGYLKLSDFMCSLSDICRVEHPPVKGRRALSHLILLPALPKPEEPCELHSSAESNESSYPPSVDEIENDDYDDYVQSIDSVIGDTEGTLSEDWSPTVEGQDGGRVGSPLLVALQLEKGEFSFFARQPTFYKEYREKCLEAKKCIRCKINTIEWGSRPCEHVLWCSECMRWINQQGPLSNKCVICDATVEQYVVVPWQKLEHQPKAIHVYDTAFPDLRTATTTLRKKK